MKKKLRITFNAPVVLSLVAISFLATLLNYITDGASGRMLFMTHPYFWTCGLVASDWKYELSVASGSDAGRKI